MQLFKRLLAFFGGGETPTPPARPLAPAKAPAPEVKAAAVTVPPVFLGWREIIDARARIAGYLLRPQALDPAGEITADGLLAALRHENVGRFASQRLLIIPLTPAQWQAADFSAIIAPQTHFLVYGLEQMATPAARQLIDDIHARGGRVASEQESPGDAGLAIDLLLLDLLAAPLNQFEQRCHRLQREQAGLRLIASEVHSWPEHRLCQTLGCSGSLGSFALARDSEAPAGKISESRLVVVDMLNLIRGGGELAQLAQCATRDPAVVVKLLDMANSPHYGLQRQVANLEEAIMLLGRDSVYRWLSLALFEVDSDHERDRTLLVLALARATLLAGLAGDGDAQRRDELFLVGLLSLIDSLLGQPMADILDRIRLPDAVATALLQQGGPYATHLQITKLLDRGQLADAVHLAETLQLSPSQLVDSYREAQTLAKQAISDPSPASPPR